MNLWKYIPHPHVWEETAHNKYFVCIERRCYLCGKWQWHGIEHKGKDFFDPYFVDGEHPNKENWK